MNTYLLLLRFRMQQNTNESKPENNIGVEGKSVAIPY
jgi:hypothetical protein